MKANKTDQKLDLELEPGKIAQTGTSPKPRFKLRYTDFAIEYALIFYRKIIYIVFEDKIHNSDYSKIDNNTLEDNFKNNFGIIINYKNVDQLPKICNSVNKEDNSQYIKKIDDFKKSNFYNLNKTVLNATNYLINNLS